MLIHESYAIPIPTNNIPNITNRTCLSGDTLNRGVYVNAFDMKCFGHVLVDAYIM